MALLLPTNCWLHCCIKIIKETFQKQTEPGKQAEASAGTLVIYIKILKAQYSFLC